MIQHSMKAIDNSLNASTSQLSGIINSVSLFHNVYNMQIKSNVTLILYSGIIDHIVSNVALLLDAKPITYLLHLPNGTTVPITHIKNITLTSIAALSNVLCVLSFQCNLISISKLNIDNHISVVFSNNNYLIQDLSQKQMVEICKADKGLYKIHFPSSTIASSVFHPHRYRVHTVPFVEAQI